MKTQQVASYHLWKRWPWQFCHPIGLFRANDQCPFQLVCGHWRPFWGLLKEQCCPSPITGTLPGFPQQSWGGGEEGPLRPQGRGLPAVAGLSSLAPKSPRAGNAAACWGGRGVCSGPAPHHPHKSPTKEAGQSGWGVGQGQGRVRDGPGWVRGLALQHPPLQPPDRTLPCPGRSSSLEGYSWGGQAEAEQERAGCPRPLGKPQLASGGAWSLPACCCAGAGGESPPEGAWGLGGAAARCVPGQPKAPAAGGVGVEQARSHVASPSVGGLLRVPLARLGEQRCLPGQWGAAPRLHTKRGDGGAGGALAAPQQPCPHEPLEGRRRPRQTLPSPPPPPARPRRRSLCQAPSCASRPARARSRPPSRAPPPPGGSAAPHQRRPPGPWEARGAVGAGARGGAA